MKTVIEMAKEAGFTEGELAFMGDNFIRFAELVRADERARMAEQPAQQQEPVAWWIPKAEQFCLPSSDGTRPFAKAWEPLYASPQPAPEDSSAVQSAPVVPDAIHHTDTSETLEYIQGWNDCRQAMLRSNT